MRIAKFALLMIIIASGVIFGQAPDSISTTIIRSTVPDLTDSVIRIMSRSRLGAFDPISRTRRAALDGDKINLGCRARALDIDGNVAYIICTDRIISVDITNLDSLVILDSCYVGTELTDIEVRGNFAFVTRVVSGKLREPRGGLILLFNIAKPGSIWLADTVFSSSGLEFRAIDLEGNIAYIATSDGLLSVDIKDPTNGDSLGFASGSRSSKDIIVDGDVAYVSGGWIAVFDVTNPRGLNLICSFDSQNQIWSMAIDGDYLFAAYYYWGFKIYDITRTDTIPTLLHSEPLPGDEHPEGIIAMGDWLYVLSSSDYNSGIFRGYDITNPSSPDYVIGVSFPDLHLFRSHKHGETWILSVGDTMGTLRSIRVAVIDEDLFTEDIIYTDIPYIPEKKAIPPSQVKVRGNYAAVVDSLGMWWINITNPTAQYWTDYGWREEDYQTIFYGLDWVGNYVYLTSSAFLDSTKGGLWILDADTPGVAPSCTSHARPDSIQYSYHHGTIGEVEVEGNVAYVFGLDDNPWTPDTFLWLYLDSYNIANPIVPNSMYSMKPLSSSYINTPVFWNQRFGVLEDI